jgi:nitrogen regulatory protein P-II 1
MTAAKIAAALAAARAPPRFSVRVTRPFRILAPFRLNPAPRTYRAFANCAKQPTPPLGSQPLSGGLRERSALKLVIGIVRLEKANDVLESLYRAEVRGVTMSRVQGHGGELERVETYRGTTVQMSLEDKMRFEIAVSDAFVEPAVNALCSGGRTGEVGDGKVFVVPLERAIRIRTGESDVSAVTPVKS